MITTIINNGAADLLAWKCEEEEFPFGTRLVVKESQQAVFFRDGQALHVFGPGMHILETGNLPFLNKLAKRFGKYFHCEVYYINHMVHREIKWGLDQRVNAFLELEPGRKAPLSVGAGGAMDIQVDTEQVTKFLTYLLGTGVSLTREDIWRCFQTMMSSAIKNHLAQVLEDQNVNVFNLNRHIGGINDALLGILKPEFDEYGIILKRFYVKDLLMPEQDPIYRQAKLMYEKRYASSTELDLNMELESKKTAHELEMAELKKKIKRVEAESAAEANVVTAQGEAARRSLENITSVQEHQFETMKEMIQAGAVSGSGSGGGGGAMGGMGEMFGDVMKMGMGFQMMKEMGDVMKDTMSTTTQMTRDLTSAGATVTATPTAPVTPVVPVIPATSATPVDQEPVAMATPSQAAADTWKCSCGQENPANMKFCGMCGQKKPEPKLETWVCSCGQENPGMMKFCGMCGQKKPLPKPVNWFCGECGQENAANMKFCGNCGTPKGGC